MVVAGDTGVILNDTMDDFSAQPGAPNVFGLVGTEANAVAPGKRPLSSMSPTIVTRERQRRRGGRRLGRPADHHRHPAGPAQRAGLRPGRRRRRSARRASTINGRRRCCWSEPGIGGGDTRRAGAASATSVDRRTGVGAVGLVLRGARRHARRRVRPAQGRQGRRLVIRLARPLRAALRSRGLQARAQRGAAGGAALRHRPATEMRAAVAAAELRWLVLAFALYVGSQLVAAAVAGGCCTRAVGFDAPLGRVIAYYFSGMYMNLFAPGHGHGRRRPRRCSSPRAAAAPWP